jgi:hypothetical protein
VVLVHLLEMSAGVSIAQMSTLTETTLDRVGRVGRWCLQSMTGPRGRVWRDGGQHDNEKARLYREQEWVGGITARTKMK